MIKKNVRRLKILTNLKLNKGTRNYTFRTDETATFVLRFNSIVTPVPCSVVENVFAERVCTVFCLHGLHDSIKIASYNEPTNHFPTQTQFWRIIAFCLLYLTEYIQKMVAVVDTVLAHNGKFEKIQNVNQRLLRQQFT